MIEYAEELFKKQNQVTYQVMMLLEDELSIADEDMLSLAELKMHDKCSLLNEMANYEMEGRKVSLYFKSQVKSSFKPCEQSLKEVELILQQLE